MAKKVPNKSFNLYLWGQDLDHQEFSEELNAVRKLMKDRGNKCTSLSILKTALSKYSETLKDTECASGIEYTAN